MPPISTSPESQASQPETPVRPEQLFREELIRDFGYLGSAQRELRIAKLVDPADRSVVSAREEAVLQAEYRIRWLIDRFPTRSIIFTEWGLYHNCVAGGPNARHRFVVHRPITDSPWTIFFAERTLDDPHGMELRRFSGERVVYRIVDGARQLVTGHDWVFSPDPKKRTR